MKKIGWLFPGQGSQVIGMGKSFYENFAQAKARFEEASDVLGFDMAQLLFEANEQLDQTEYAQPAILMVSVIACELLKEHYEHQPVFGLGHSLGEISAVTALGGLKFCDALRLVHERGKLMKKACEGRNAGMSVILGLDDDKVESLVQQAQESGKHVWCANYNMDGQLVLAGFKDDLVSLETLFKEAGAKRAMLLNMSVASHCPLLQSASEELKVLLTQALTTHFDAPIYSNATAELYETKESAIELLTTQLISPVRYKQSLNKAMNEADIMIEFGGKVLAGLNKKATIPTLSLVEAQHIESIVKELV